MSLELNSENVIQSQNSILSFSSDSKEGPRVIFEKVYHTPNELS